MMKFKLGIITIIGVMFMMMAFPTAADEEEMFPLMAWDYADDEATLKSMADCGINAVAFVPIKALGICKKLGLKAIVFDERVAGDNWAEPFDADRACKALPDLIKQVNSHPAVYGYHLKDEPSHLTFDALARACAVVRELAPGKWPYINLLPGDGPAFDDYLEQFIKTCKPPIISYDRYVTPEDGSFSPAFWTNLAQVRQAAARHGLPFHNIILTAAHWHYRELTATDIRLQVFGSLVYGAKGIAYYKFCSGSLPILDAPDLGNFRMGPLDEFGEKTQTWEWLRNTNRKVLNLAPTLLKLKSDDVYHIGDIPERNHGVNDKSLVKGMKWGDQWIIGEFTHEDGSKWLMFVNKHPSISAMCQPEFTQPVKELHYVSPISGELKPFGSYYALAPGQGVLIKVVMDSMK